MEKYAWHGYIVEGKKEEYIKRHKEIWPEMVKVLKEAGISNYSIWCEGNELFGYYECEKGVKFAQETQKNSPIVDKWNQYMEGILILPMDPETGAQPIMEQVFELK